MSDSFAVYGPWLIGGIAGLVAFFVAAAIMRVVVRRRDRIKLERRRRSPETIRPIQPIPPEPVQSRVPSKQAPHVGWLLILLAAALIGAVVIVLAPQAKGDGTYRSIPRLPGSSPAL